MPTSRERMCRSEMQDRCQGSPEHIDMVCALWSVELQHGLKHTVDCPETRWLVFWAALSYACFLCMWLGREP
ncbi:hypothetical protein J4Q44_G00375150 [Coregonus suidteri]|uniref:Uncharacterized protein n=1 Tax=Coregonus suidteri TaxID=861788 RepID=A0AAN8KSU2_9TELE